MTIPYVRGSDTSRAAAESMAENRLNELQRHVLAFLRSRGARGASDEEMRDIDTIKHELLLFREREHAWAKARADLERAVAAEQAAAAKERERSALLERDLRRATHALLSLIGTGC